MLRTVGLTPRLALGGALALGLALAFTAGTRLRSPDPVASDGTAALAPEGLRTEVLAYLRRHYIRPLPQDLPRHVGVRSLLAALDDPYTRYLSPRDYRTLRRQQDGRYGGIGLGVVHDARGLAVSTLLPGMPAARAGLRVGDVITRLDGQALRHVDYARRLALLRGPAGSELRLRIVRAGRPGADVLRVTRRALVTPSVVARTVSRDGERYLHLRLLSFPEGVGARVRRIAERARTDGTAGVVLDLRGDPGGLLPEAIATARVFVGDGPLVTAVSPDGRRTYRAAGDAVGLPVAVLVDGATASSAEVVAGALAGTAPLVGARTFGKGTVQAVYPLSNGGALKVTAARLELPDGVQFDGRGIPVDVRAADRAGTSADEAVDVALATLATTA